MYLNCGPNLDFHPDPPFGSFKHYLGIFFKMQAKFFWLQNLYMFITEKLKVIEKLNEKRERGRGEESIVNSHC